MTGDGVATSSVDLPKRKHKGWPALSESAHGELKCRSTGAYSYNTSLGEQDFYPFRADTVRQHHSTALCPRATTVLHPRRDSYPFAAVHRESKDIEPDEMGIIY